MINPKSIYTVGKKEFLDNIRNKWMIIITVLFVILLLIISYVAGGQSGGDSVFGDIQTTVIALLVLSSIFVPLIGIILGFSTISGEAESGALYVVLSYPVKRLEVLLGKTLGLGSVIAVSVFIGFGIGGIIIAATTSAESWTGYIIFIFLTIILGIVHLSVSIFISSICKSRTRSIGGGILIFLWGFLIYDTVILSIYFALGNSIDELVAGNIPDWFLNSQIFSPVDIYNTAVSRAFGVESINSVNFSLPVLLIVLMLWIIIPLILAYIFFKRRDI